MACITTIPVIDSYEAVGIGTCNRALLVFHVVPPISYRRRFVGPLVEGESIAYRWTGKDKVRIKLLQNPKQREFTVPVFKVFDWTQVKPNLLTAGFTKLAGFCGPETAFGNVRTNLLSIAGQNAPVSGKTSEEQSTFKTQNSAKGMKMPLKGELSHGFVSKAVWVNAGALSSGTKEQTQMARNRGSLFN
jgi:hypothetical protein